jgi:PKHD-type hydroxylase
MLYHQYVSITESFISEEEVDNINEWFEKNAEEHDASISFNDDFYRKSKVRWGSPSALAKDHKDIVDKIDIGVKHKASEIGMNYDITKTSDYQHTTYYASTDSAVSGDRYKWHPDMIIEEDHPRKLSMVIQLSDADDYEAGDFQWIHPWEAVSAVVDHRTPSEMNECIKTLPSTARKKGTMIVFPSYLYHQVIPVTKGIRKSLVWWLNGPHFK